MRSPSTRTVQHLVAIAIAPMVAVTMAFALTGDHLERPIAAGLYWGYLTAASMLIGLYWWQRRPAQRFGLAACQRPERSGWPSGRRGVRAVRLTVPSAFRGSPSVGYLIH